MKNFIFIFVIALMAVACQFKKGTTSVSPISDTVTVDSVAVDSVAVDSLAVDSVAVTDDVQ